MFSHLKPLPTDPILGLMAAYNSDSNPNKIDLGVGVYKDEYGDTPVLKCVKQAEALRLNNETTKSYIGLAGDLNFTNKMEHLLLGEHNALLANRVRTAQTPGGTGALRVAAEFVKRCNPDATIWVSAPTWANHMSLFEAAGLTVKEYPYYDYETRGLQFDNMKKVIGEQVKQGDVVLFHACCHNPSGMDLTLAQWQEMAELAKEKSFTPMIDIAYLGFGEGIDEDAAGLRLMVDAVPESIICSSCSKNFGLYRERIGACSIVAEDAQKADVANSVLLSVVRSIYSMPPAHGATIVNTILSSNELTQLWHSELAEMRNRINELRSLIVDKLSAKGIDQSFEFIKHQHGMFSFFGIDKPQIEQLRTEYSIYMVGSSRMNVAGISLSNIDYFADSVASVLANK
ncbi:amino acid aminotransferase [Flocculibacter collagenilyticus]|uniref:amino acid aminotransferase n=1 Tax=Flocculibacter collagenilyticus TaxID=2744479 RepID=UPI0018F614E2|nr:amino acid aminotransferase [Flocculibacter collagenilyticus]